jgi:hypothetical protein
MNSGSPTFRLSLIVLCLVSLIAPVSSAPPPLREQISLNGEWPQGGKVPVYDSQNSVLKTRTYEREVTVPTTWVNKRIRLEFAAVNHFCELYINDLKVGEHNGAWVPFGFDITDYVRRQRSFALRLDVRGKMMPPTVVDGQVAWWIGHNSLDDRRSGIVDDVWLRAYSPVYIRDAFIQTSTRLKRLTVVYEVVNTTAAPWVGELVGEVQLEKGGPVEKRIGQAISLAPGERKSLTTETTWTNPKLWWPDDPHLYVLKSRLAGGGAKGDSEQRRFGFREFWTEGTQFRLNGIRINLRGDWCAYSQYWGDISSPAVLRRHYEAVLRTNSNILRWHKHPAPQFAYHMADEMGLMILAETPAYARSYHKHIDHAAFISRAHELLPELVRGLRNHPSIVMWSACNEMTYGFAGFSPQLLKTLGEAIAIHDTTRPISYDGDYMVPGPIYNRHYPEGYEKNPIGDSYTGWRNAMSPDKPTYYGEILAVRPDKNDNAWWIGIWPRGLRYQNVAGIAPRVYYAGTRISKAQEDLQRLAYHPIALFDIAYDKLGIAPYKDGALPELIAGETVTRDLVIYNDDLRDESVVTRVVLKLGAQEYAAGESTTKVPIAEHRELTATFQVPYEAGEILDVYYISLKDGKLRFREKKQFRIVGTPRTTASDRRVTLRLAQ